MQKTKKALERAYSRNGEYAIAQMGMKCHRCPYYRECVADLKSSTSCETFIAQQLRRNKNDIA